MSQAMDDLLNQLQMVQRMIDISATKLHSLRVEGATDTNLIQQEIRTVEVGNIYQELRIGKVLTNGCYLVA